jgi:cytochrome c553
LKKRCAGRWAWLAALLLSCAAHGQLPEALAERVKSCAACHGADGNSPTTGVPSIAGQPRVFLETQLVLTREGMRGAEVMQGLLRGLKDPEIIAIAKHFAELPARAAPTGATDAALVKRGRRLAAKLRCGICHLKDYSGQQQIPRLAGQREEYLRDTLIAFRDHPRPGGDTQMSAVLYGVSNDDIKALAHFLARFR